MVRENVYRLAAWGVLVGLASGVTAQERRGDRPGNAPAQPRQVVPAQPGQVVPAQPVRPGVVEGQIGVDQSAAAGQSLRAKQILGAKIRIEQNNDVGTVDDLVIDDQGNVDYVLVVVQDGQYVTVPWDAVEFNLEEQVANVHITLEKFRTIPTYTAQQYPSFTAPSYRTQTYQYFGLTPGQQRRMVRRSTR